MAVINGTTMRLIMDGNPIGATKSCTLNINNATGDASNKDSGGWWNGILGQRDWDISFDGLYDPTGTYNMEYLFDEIYERDSTLIAEIAQIDGVGGGEVFRGNVLVTNLTLTAPMEDVVAISGTLKGTGELYKSTVASS